MPAPTSSTSGRGAAAKQGQGQIVTLVVAWAAVGIPLMWGVVETFRKALALFG